MTTPSQTVGPFFALPDGLPWPDGPEVVAEGTPGAVVIRGTVYDGAGDPVPDAMIETWQASAAGRFDHPDDPRGAVDEGFRGFGRSATDPEGNFWLRTVKPGPLPTPDGGAEAPHIDVTVLARGLLQRLVTRIYWPDEEQANAADPVLGAVPAELRHTLIARREGDELRFDIRLQGDRETVFFEL
ncbi:protocatechuate 3,4-dioxygenase subunit alpha [Kutzneria sp. 744]|uniref:protocatechuate 3,4-dioxygenase subunit alpha n=1 Tax=Kutzneria sp. (strain 744) TaxID=345341 RepID=UPI0003EED425|nr:protocatechuate 3,4-dioxygenase subunit alpha [Kutzneria sp. 744]EWM12408.1 protocatechuate 3,4-dioxygenase, alpha subunit [Kutzneria sp. 744]